MKMEVRVDKKVKKYGAYVRLVRGDDMVFCYSYGRFELLDFNMRHGTSYNRCVAT